MSSALDEDVVRTVDSGRETLGAMLGAAQQHLQKVFIVFVVGLIGTIVALQEFVWTMMKTDLNRNPDIVIVAVTPFDVILLQIKIGLVVGALLAIPPLLYYARQPLRERGLWVFDRVDIPRWQFAGIGLVSLGLFVGGVAYAYFLFFPLMLDFLASNATSAGFEPKYSIVMWAQFIFLLSMSFGLAAQLPLVMSGLSYTEIVPYETFRDKWKYAVVGIFVFGAFFSPPDPFTQIMWAVPLLFLYALSLSLARFVVTARVSSEVIGVRSVVRRRWNVLAGAFVLAAAGAYLFGQGLFAGNYDGLLQQLPSPIRPGLFARDAVLGLPVPYVLAAAAVVVGAVAVVVAVVAVLFSELEELPPPKERQRRARGGTEAAPASTGGPADLDLSGLDAAGVRAAPIETFTEMTEDEAVALAREAMDDGDPDRAEAILDRFDRAQELVDASPEEKGATAAAANRVDEDGNLQPLDGEGEESEADAGPDLSTLDIAEMTADQVRAAPEERFAGMTEDRAVELAQAAMDEGDAERAEAIFDRFDAAADAAGPGAVAVGTWSRSPESRLALLALGSTRVDWGRRFGRIWNLLAALAVLVAGGAYLSVTEGYVTLPDALAGLAAPATVALGGGLLVGAVLAGLVAGVLALVWAYGAATDPTAVDLTTLSVREIRNAPSAAFFGTTEEDAARVAERLAGRSAEKAEAYRERFAEVETERESADTRRRAGVAADDSVFSRTGAGMLGAFTEDEVEEDDIGGYYYDIAFILDSVTSKAFWMVGWFMAVLAVTFVALYQGGIGVLKNQFYDRLPDAVEPTSVELVTLHPVEALIFEIKVSTIIAAVATLPMLLYFAWPALKERGFASGDRNVLLTWAGTLFGGLIVGSLVGFLYVAPSIISWLAADVVQNQMLIRYRINNFGWLVFFTTVGVGLLIDVPLTMLLFHRGGLVPYETMKSRWREVTIGIFAIAAFGSPKGIFTMFLLGIPIMAFYGLGLAILRVYVALGGKGGRPPLIAGQEAD